MAEIYVKKSVMGWNSKSGNRMSVNNSHNKPKIADGRMSEEMTLKKEARKGKDNY